MSIYTKIDKEIATYTKRDKDDSNGWLVYGWLVYGWLFGDIYTKINKGTATYTKINK